MAKDSYRVLANRHDLWLVYLSREEMIIRGNITGARQWWSVLLVSALSASGAMASDYSTAIDTNVVQDVRQGATFTFEINPNLSPYTFKLVGDPESNTIKRIDVYIPNSKRPIESLKVGQGESPYRASAYFKAVDINFDGYQDIGLLNWWGATGNEGWDFWRFDPKTKGFVYSSEVSALGRPEFDAATKTITAFSKGGWCQYSTTTYQYDKDKLRRTGGKTCEQPKSGKPGDECDCSIF